MINIFPIQPRYDLLHPSIQPVVDPLSHPEHPQDISPLPFLQQVQHLLKVLRVPVTPQAKVAGYISVLLAVLPAPFLQESGKLLRTPAVKTALLPMDRPGNTGTTGSTGIPGSADRPSGTDIPRAPGTSNSPVRPDDLPEAGPAILVVLQHILRLLPLLPASRLLL